MSRTTSSGPGGGQVLAALVQRLRREPAELSTLLPLDDVVGALGRRGQRYLGPQTIRLDTIVGSVGSRRDFDRHFRPTSNRVRSRWEELALAGRRGAPIPPSRCTAWVRRIS